MLRYKWNVTYEDRWKVVWFREDSAENTITVCHFVMDLHECSQCRLGGG